jgi:hypothetical protein
MYGSIHVRNLFVHKLELVKVTATPAPPAYSTALLPIANLNAMGQAQSPQAQSPPYYAPSPYVPLYLASPVITWKRMPDGGKGRKIEILNSLGVPVEVVWVDPWQRLVSGLFDPTEKLSVEIFTQLQWILYYFLLELPHKRIRKLEYVWNETMYRRFNETKEELRRWGKSTAECPLFHGTAPENIDRWIFYIITT